MQLYGAFWLDIDLLTIRQTSTFSGWHIGGRNHIQNKNKKKIPKCPWATSLTWQGVPPLQPAPLPSTTSLTYITLIYSDFFFICIDVSQTCLQQAAAGSCEFYDCFEQRFPCGNCGFNKHYSTYDCEKFYLPVYYNQFNDLVSKPTRDCQVFGLSDILRRKQVLIRNGESG